MQLLPKKGMIIPEMGIIGIDKLADTLFSKSRQAILSLLYQHTDLSFYVNQIIDFAGIGTGTVQRELRLLHQAGIITRNVQGKQVYYSANRDCPIFSELKSIVVKTAGLYSTIKAALSRISAKIQLAFVFGSVAAGTEGKRSDIDLIVVGEVSFAEVVKSIQAAQKKLRREINPVVYSVREFRQEIHSGRHFINTVIEGEKIFILGNDNELKRLAGGRSPQGT